MEFNVKLQELRKQRGLTQEELAEALYVSRTAVSKWESGRGYPSIDSLKEIAKFFSVTIDDLLSSNEVLNIAEEDSKQKEKHFQSVLFALLDISVAMFFFLPLFKGNINGITRELTLLSLDGISSYLKVVYYVTVISIIIYGILTLTLQNCQRIFWLRIKDKISIALSVAAVLLFIISLQPYAAASLFIYLIIKVFMLKNK